MKKYLLTFKQLISLAGPLVMAQIAHMGMQVIDTLMLGQLGAKELATGALGGVIIYNIAVFCVGILSASGTLLAQAFGANDKLQIRNVLSQAVILSLTLSVICILIIVRFTHVLAWFGVDPDLLATTDIFLKALLWGLPAWMLFFVLRDYIAVVGHAKIIMTISIAAIPANAILNYILMYGKFGLPELGVAGIGYSTSIIRWLMLTSLGLHIIKHQKLRDNFNLQLKFNPAVAKQILKLGYPIGLMMALEIGMFSISTFAMASFGVIALAAHQVAIQCANVVFTMPLGISQATGILVGKAVGSKNTKIIPQTTGIAISVGFILALIVAAVFYFFPVLLTRVFLDLNLLNNIPVQSYAITFLLMAAILQMLDTIQIILIGALRGMSDTFMPMVLGCIAYWIFGLSSGWLFAFALDLGGVGLWYGLCIGISISSILLFLRLKQLCIQQA